MESYIKVLDYLSYLEIVREEIFYFLGFLVRESG